MSILASSGMGQSWLAWQCGMVSGLVGGVLFAVDEQANLGESIAAWPSDDNLSASLRAVAGQALKQGQGVTRSQQQYESENQRYCDLIASPIRVDEQPVAVVAVMISNRSEAQQHAVLQLIQWGALWLDNLVQAQQSAQSNNDAFVLALLNEIYRTDNIQLIAMSVVNQLAERTGCSRISIGLRKGGTIRLQAISHLTSFDPRTQLIRQIEAAMEEAIDQDKALLYQPGMNSDGDIHRAHRELAESQFNETIVSLPLKGQHKVIGALTFEQPGNQDFDKKTLELITRTASAVGPALALKLSEQRSLLARGQHGLTSSLKSLLGPSHLRFKMTVILAGVLFALLSVVDGSYRVTAPASIEGQGRQFLVSPLNGYIIQADARAGDLVKEGQILAALDQRDLKLELSRRRSERNQVEREYHAALALRELNEVSVLRARLQQVEAELQLVEQQLERTQLRAPFDGVVLSGDLSQSLGSAVELGQVLFEVAPIGSFRVVLEVDEHDVASVTQGLPAELVIAALPRAKFELSVEQIMPVTVAENGRNFFRVEATLEEPAPLLRPGMHGVAKIESGQRSLLWIWTHSLVDRLKLWAWSLGW